MLSLFAKESIGSICFIVFALSIAVLIIKNRKDFSISRIPTTAAILMIAYFVLGLIGVVINTDSKSSYFTRLIPFLVSPLLFYYFNAFKNNINSLLKIFLFGNLILLVLLDLWAIVDMVKNQSLFIIKDGREYYRFLYTRYTDAEYFNHIYLSVYSFLSAILLFQFNLTTKRIKWSLTLYLLIHLFMMGSRAMVIAMIFGAVIFLIIASIRNKKYIKYLLVLGISLLVLTTTAYIFRDTVFFNRYSQVFEWYEKSDLLLKRNNSINKRYKIYILGASASSDHHGGIIGTGIAENQIKHTYETKFFDKFSFKTDTYNTHNQYFNNFIDWGYLGLIVLVWLLIIIARDSLKQRLFWITFFWICFAILLSMESVLFRQRGVLLFILFYTLFAQAKISAKSNISNVE